MKPRLLVIDDEPDIRKTLKMTLEYEGYEVLTASSGNEGLERARVDRPDAILLDIKMPGLDGLEVLERLKGQAGDSAVLMISGHGDIADAVRATRLGAIDFLEKPLEQERLSLAIRNALEQRRLKSEVAQLRRADESRFELVGASRAMVALRGVIKSAAPTNATVLITGESGTGKELVARALHKESPRAETTFIKVNCAAIPEDLIESELFGHERGSFTGASGRQIGKFVQADKGTIFLDEIGDMSARTQAKVLRVLETGEVEPVGAARVIVVNVRVIAATNKDLAAEIRKGTFREDLYFRLKVIPITLPSLRERPEDIPELIGHFVGMYARENNLKPKTLTPAAVSALSRMPWKGNVRELRNTVERILIMTPKETIDAADLPGEAMEAAGGTGMPAPAAFATLREFKEVAEKAFIIAKLEANDWNISKTAKEIDTPRSNLYKKLEQYGLAKEDRDQEGEAAEEPD
ncbi:MAG: sigma-54-dependent Fis family transcriptional regulator [Acidobacteria bacterium]|nr:sigma-54-dependent Fis family transcriptional regulator [Acidobacteriota bacterium]